MTFRPVSLRLLLPIAFITGCATTGRDSYERMRLEVDHSAAPDSPNERRADDAALSGPVLDRAAFVRAVLRRSPSIESARQAWRAAVARVRESGAMPDPMVTFEVAPLSIGSTRARFGYDAAISQQLPWPGKLALDESVAAAEAAAARSDYQAARRQLALTAATLFDQYFVAARSLAINAHHVALMRSMQSAATSQYETGRASAQDPLQAEFELAHMEHDAVTLASQREIVIAQMNELLHREPSDPLPPPPEILGTPPFGDRHDVGRLEKEAIHRRAEIAATGERARAQTARADRASRESLPDVTLSTSYNSMWDVPEHRWMVGLSLNLPVVTGRRAGAVDEAKAMRAQYQADAERLRDETRTEVVVALKRLEESDHVLRLYDERLLPVARDEVDAARAAFVASQAPFGAVVDAEKNLRGVELDEQLARAELDRRYAELEAALGRIPGVESKENER